MAKKSTKVVISKRASKSVKNKIDSGNGKLKKLNQCIEKRISYNDKIEEINSKIAEINNSEIQPRKFEIKKFESTIKKINTYIINNEEIIENNQKFIDTFRSKKYEKSKKYKEYLEYTEEIKKLSDKKDKLQRQMNELSNSSYKGTAYKRTKQLEETIKSFKTTNNEILGRGSSAHMIKWAKSIKAFDDELKKYANEYKLPLHVYDVNDSRVSSKNIKATLFVEKLLRLQNENERYRGQIKKIIGDETHQGELSLLKEKLMNMEDDIIDHVTNTKDRSNKYNYLKSFKKLTDKRDLLEAKRIALITNTKSDARKINPDDYYDEFDELYGIVDYEFKKVIESGKSIDIENAMIAKELYQFYIKNGGSEYVKPMIAYCYSHKIEYDESTKSFKYIYDTNKDYGTFENTEFRVWYEVAKPSGDPEVTYTLTSWQIVSMVDKGRQTYIAHAGANTTHNYLVMHSGRQYYPYEKGNIPMSGDITIEKPTFGVYAGMGIKREMHNIVNRHIKRCNAELKRIDKELNKVKREIKKKDPIFFKQNLEYKKLQDKIKNTEAQVQKLRDAINSNMNELRPYMNYLRMYNNIDERIEQHKQEKEKYKQALNARQYYKELLKEYNESKKKITSQTAARKKYLRTRYDKFNNEIEMIKSTNRYQSVSGFSKYTQDESNKLSNEIISLTSKNGGYKNKIDDINENINKLNEKILKSESKIYNFTVKIENLRKSAEENEKIIETLYNELNSITENLKKEKEKDIHDIIKNINEGVENGIKPVKNKTIKSNLGKPKTPKVKTNKQNKVFDSNNNIVVTTVEELKNQIEKETENTLLNDIDATEELMKNILQKNPQLADTPEWKKYIKKLNKKKNNILSGKQPRKRK